MNNSKKINKRIKQIKKEIDNLYNDGYLSNNTFKYNGLIYIQNFLGSQDISFKFDLDEKFLLPCYYFTSSEERQIFNAIEKYNHEMFGRFFVKKEPPKLTIEEIKKLNNIGYKIINSKLKENNMVYIIKITNLKKKNILHMKI